MSGAGCPAGRRLLIGFCIAAQTVLVQIAVSWAVLGESLGPLQMAGAAIVVIAFQARGTRR